MARRIPVCVIALLVACTPSEDSAVTAPSPPPATESPPPTELPTTEPTPSPRPISAPPPPRTPLPGAPKEFANELVMVEAELKRAIDLWLDRGGTLGGRDALGVSLRALRQQKLYRALVGDPALARRVIAVLPNRFGRRVRRDVDVAAALRAGVRPVEPPLDLATAAPASPHKLLRWYRAAGRANAIDPWILAAVNFTETRFGRILGPSVAGALGPMQFLPSTWERYGRGGDIRDPHDSIFAAARFLEAHGGRSNIAGALLAYNNSQAYVDAVLTYAHAMERDLRNYFAFYFWEVFVITTEGDVQLTGPGAGPRR